VNRVARLLSAGHGGQTLLSRATRDHLEGHLPEGVSVRDMGERRLKDLKEPERIHQLSPRTSLPSSRP
jgi:class 3 adenylate cyclase